MRPSAIDLIQDEKNVYYPAKKNAAYAQSVSVQKPTSPVHRRCFIFLFFLLENIGVPEHKASTPTPLCWRSINPPQFIFYHERSTDFEEKVRGSANS